ncbi:MAG: hypothetical protein ACLSCV_03450 [Acutalibacteraceae bacterium]
MKADEKVASIADEVEEKKEELEKMRQIVSDFRKTLLDKYKEHLTLINNIPNRKTGETGRTQNNRNRQKKISQKNCIHSLWKSI